MALRGPWVPGRHPHDARTSDAVAPRRSRSRASPCAAIPPGSPASHPSALATPAIAFQNLTLGHDRHPPHHPQGRRRRKPDRHRRPVALGKSTLWKGMTGTLAPLEGRVAFMVLAARHSASANPMIDRLVSAVGAELPAGALGRDRPLRQARRVRQAWRCRRRCNRGGGPDRPRGRDRSDRCCRRTDAASALSQGLLQDARPGAAGRTLYRD